MAHCIQTIILLITTTHLVAHAQNQSLLLALATHNTSAYERFMLEENTSFIDKEFVADRVEGNDVAIQRKRPSLQQATSYLGDPHAEKEWTLLVYMAADNDLRGFGVRNLQQLCSIGSTQHINIIVECHTRISNNKKITRRYLIEKDKMLQITDYKEADQPLDSGTANTLISFCNWGIASFPAKKYGLVLWNHGSGIVDPIGARITNPSTLFTYNPVTNKLELDRSIGFLDFINRCDSSLKERGICWDDETGHYLTNQDLGTALNTIQTNSLNGKKFEFIGFDACLMSMLEIASIVKNHAHFMIASQELELAAGWRYDTILKPLKESPFNTLEFITHIVETYGDNYNKITDDYTLSAIRLETIESVEKNLDKIAQLLLEALSLQKEQKIKNVIRASKNKFLCTHFDEPSYIDLHHFYRNLQASLKHFEFADTKAGAMIIEKLEQLLSKGRSLIEEAVIANRVGKNLKEATGISIYFPENRVHSSYKKTTFATSNTWHNFLNKYMTT